MRANGALVLARNADEADVLQEFADTRLRQEGYRAELLSGREVAALYDGRLAHHCAALRGLDDLQIYSREALPAITRHLAESLGVTSSPARWRARWSRAGWRPLPASSVAIMCSSAPAMIT